MRKSRPLPQLGVAIIGAHGAGCCRKRLYCIGTAIVAQVYSFQVDLRPDRRSNYQLLGIPRNTLTEVGS